MTRTNNTRAMLCALVATQGLSGCGLKDDLYIPDDAIEMVDIESGSETATDSDTDKDPKKIRQPTLPNAEQ